MRRSGAHEYRQAYNAQAVVCAEGSQLILATNLVATTADAPSFAATVLGMEDTIGLPQMVLADTGFASAPAVAALQARDGDRAHTAASSLRLPSATQAQIIATHHRAVAYRHAGQTTD